MSHLGRRRRRNMIRMDSEEMLWARVDEINLAQTDPEIDSCECGNELWAP